MTRELSPVFRISDILSHILNYAGIGYTQSLISNLMLSCSEMLNNVQRCLPNIRCATLDDSNNNIISKLSGLYTLNVISADYLNMVSPSNLRTINISYCMMDNLYLFSEKYPNLIFDGVTKFTSSYMGNYVGEFCIGIQSFPSSLFPNVEDLTLYIGMIDNVHKIKHLTSLTLISIRIFNPEIDDSLNRSNVEHLYLENVISGGQRYSTLSSPKLKNLVIISGDLDITVMAKNIEYIRIQDKAYGRSRKYEIRYGRRLEYVRCSGIVLDLAHCGDTLESLVIDKCSDFFLYGPDIEYIRSDIRVNNLDVVIRDSSIFRISIVFMICVKSMILERCHQIMRDIKFETSSSEIYFHSEVISIDDNICSYSRYHNWMNLIRCVLDDINSLE